MTQEEYFKFADRFFNRCLEISRAKNADYTGGSADPFANFTSVENLHISTEAGFITRMNDKLMRIASFAKQGSLQIKDESVTDTLRDLANYCCLMAGYLESKKQQGVTEDPSDQILSGGVCGCVVPVVLGDQVLIGLGKRLNFQQKSKDRYRVYFKSKDEVTSHSFSKGDFDHHFTILKLANV